MDGDIGMLDRLRSRLAAMEQRQRASGGTADPSFWPRAEATTAATSGTAAQSQAQSTRARQHRSRPQAPSARQVWRGTGPWCEIPLEQFGTFGKFERPQQPDQAEQAKPPEQPEQPGGIDPLSVRWASDDELNDPGWIAATAQAAEARQANADHPPHEPPTHVMVDAVAGISLHRHHDDDLGRAGEWIAHQRASHEVMLVNVVAELESRGLEAPGGLSRTDWLRAHDPSLTAAAARAITTVGAVLNLDRWATLRLLITTQQVTVGNAAQIIGFDQQVRSVADPADLQTAVDDLVAQAKLLRPEELAKLVRHHTEQVRPPRDDDALDEGRRRSRGLWFGQPNRTGMVSMRGILDPEAAAIIKSAIDPLSAPCPTTAEHGKTQQADPRSPAQRRADALVELVSRAVSAPDGVRNTDKAKVVVLIDLETLLEQLRGTGHTLSGDIVSPETVRRWACDAGIIPIVLGTQGEPLDVGREKRLVTKGLRLALIARDRGCSFPGCTIPPQWTDAHHVVHWARGGRTSLLTTALLCQRHHTHVHRHDLTATVTATRVTWHV